jgi:Spy/CpxP family protein refolding chaperone
MTIRNAFAASLLTLVALALLVWGQSAGGEAAPAGAGPDSPPPRSGRGFGPRRGGGFLDDVKAQIRASDEEWKVIGPKLRDLILLRQIIEGGAGFGFDSRPGGFPEPGGPERGGGPRGGGFGGPPSEGPGSAGSGGADFAPLIQARADLRTALDDPKTSPDAVREAVAAVRQARRKARAALADAGKDLLELLTVDQEAMLVALGHLD